MLTKSDCEKIAKANGIVFDDKGDAWNIAMVDKFGCFVKGKGSRGSYINFNKLFGDDKLGDMIRDVERAQKELKGIKLEIASENIKKLLSKEDNMVALIVSSDRITISKEGFSFYDSKSDIRSSNYVIETRTSISRGKVETQYKTSGISGWSGVRDMHFNLTDDEVLSLHKKHEERRVIAMISNKTCGHDIVTTIKSVRKSLISDDLFARFLDNARSIAKTYHDRTKKDLADRHLQIQRREDEMQKAISEYN